MNTIEDMIKETFELYKTDNQLKNTESQLLTALEISKTLPSAINQEYCEKNLSETTSKIKKVNSRQQELSEMTTEILTPIYEVQNIRKQIHQSFENLLGGLLLAQAYEYEFSYHTEQLINTPYEIDDFIEEFEEDENFSINFQTFCLKNFIDINAIANYGFANFIKKINEREDWECYIFSNTKDLTKSTRIYHHRSFKCDLDLKYTERHNSKTKWFYNKLHYIFHGNEYSKKTKVPGMGILRYYRKLCEIETINKYFHVKFKVKNRTVRVKKSHTYTYINADKEQDIDLKPKPTLYDLFSKNDKITQEYQKYITKAKTLLSDSIQ